MSEIANRYRRLCGEFADTVAQVSPDRWTSQSPCTNSEAFGEALRQSGVCGPPVEVAANADDQTKLLVLLGRHV